MSSFFKPSKPPEPKIPMPQPQMAGLLGRSASQPPLALKPAVAESTGRPALSSSLLGAASAARTVGPPAAAGQPGLDPRQAMELLKRGLYGQG